ncbi:aromatic amino acid ammonia-lyase [Achromobacter sp. Bel]|uniref:HAL/PAL/TAL family ammonia-lyase n=1 Tax=Achromobacter sp. Bel TaxID=2727415 RepID=UPI00145CA31E|nr:aromatic amino acid ammonia-lyase [Achromobacter sp. Bel]NMK47925.1 aromatic amino acid lyase [Achromobacter sp. Bel]
MPMHPAPHALARPHRKPLLARLRGHLPALRRTGIMAPLLLALGYPAGASAACTPVTLDGRSLTLEQVGTVARQGCQVVLADDAAARAQRSFELLLAYARLDRPVYGLNRGVGLNKDQTLFKGGDISPEVRKVSEQFNRNLLRSHSAAYGAETPQDVTRAAMLIRLNSALYGGSGLQVEVLRQYAAFLNRGITPVMLGEGSVGQADITILAQIGLAMMGEGESYYGGRRMPSAEALERAGLKPVRPFGKDALAIVSSNAYGAAVASLAALDAARLLDQADAVAALSLEGLDGNLAPLLAATQAQRPYDGQRHTAAHMLVMLRGSSLWQPSPKRALQDPLSFRTVSQAHGAARDMLGLLRRQLQLQINSSDDNPTVALDAQPAADAQAYEAQYYVTDGPVRGAVLPSAGFDPSAWVLPLQSLGVALSQTAQLSAQRTLRLTDTAFTALPRFLSPGNGAIGYGPIQKTVSSLATDVRTLSSPIVTDVQAQAGNIEDVGTNAPATGRRVAAQVDRLTMLLAVELMHAAQAVDLRRAQRPGLELGAGTAALWRDFRKQVPYMDEDRRNDVDIVRATGFLALNPQGAEGQRPAP